MDQNEFLKIASGYDVDLFLGGFSGARYLKPEALEKEVRHEIAVAQTNPTDPEHLRKVFAIAGGTTMGIGAIYGMKDLGADTGGIVSSEAKKYPEDLAPGKPILFVDRPANDWGVGGVNITIAKALQAQGKEVSALYFNGGKVSGDEIREYADNGIPVKINNHPDLLPLKPNVTTVLDMWAAKMPPLDVQHNISMGSTYDVLRTTLDLKKEQMPGDTPTSETGKGNGESKLIH
jgi:hypothetical protein